MIMNMMVRRKAPSLVDLCIRTAIDNVRYLGDVGETDIGLLSHILPHCTVDQLGHIEKCTEVRQLHTFKLNTFLLFSVRHLTSCFMMDFFCVGKRFE